MKTRPPVPGPAPRVERPTTGAVQADPKVSSARAASVATSAPTDAWNAVPHVAGVERGDARSALSSVLHSETLSFRDVEGPNTNVFLQTASVATQVVVSSTPQVRAIASFPSGNSGVALFASPLSPKAPPLHWTVGEVTPGVARPGAQRATMNLVADQRSFVIDQVVLDSLRSVREVTEGTGKALALAPEQSALQKPPVVELDAKETRVRLTRVNLDGSAYECVLHLPPQSQVTVNGGALEIRAPGQGPLAMQVDAEVPFAPLNPLPVASLLNPQALHQLENLDPADPQTAQTVKALQSLRFLSYQPAVGPDGKALPYSDKFLAGGWRFETYFGRDTMLSAMMLQNIVSPQALEAALGSVLDRVSSTGQVAHEEDIGTFAERRRLLEAPEGTPGRLEAAKRQDPIFDYKMIDGDLLLPVLMARYAETVPPEQLNALLAKPTPDGHTRAEAAQRNIDFIAAQAAQYTGSATSLMRIHDGEYVGDWRDSNVGLGGGVYPGSVNLDLVTNALKAVRALTSTRDAAGLMAPAGTDALLRRWEDAKAHFEVTLAPSELRQRLRSFVDLPSNAGQKARLLQQNLGPSADGKNAGVTLQEFLDGALPSSLARGYSFAALSLDDAGAPIPVPNSDSSLRLFLGDPTPEAISAMLPSLELPYPVGLMTPAGLLTANPAFAQANNFSGPDRNGKMKTAPLTEWLDRAGYHGSVVWVWQQAMMQLGLMRQIERLAADPANGELVRRMEKVLDALRQATHDAGALANAELLGFDDEGRATAFGQAMGSDTEANAAQLWSTVTPAVDLAYSELKRKLVHR